MLQIAPNCSERIKADQIGPDLYKMLYMAPTGSNWLQIAPNYSKCFKMTMANANG